MSAPSEFAHAKGTHLFVGREREQAILRHHLASALGGYGSLVLISGEAGIGKTSLAEMICHEAEQQGARVLTGRCYDLSDTPPYGPWVELFSRYRREHNERLAPPPAFARRGIVEAVDNQATLFEQTLAFVATLTENRPLVLVLEDLHWADPASLDLLRILARNLATLPVLLFVTYRVEEIAHHHPLYALIPVLVREGAVGRLVLPPLQSEEVHAIVAHRYILPPPDLTRLATYLHTRADGNPFAIGELLHTMEGEHLVRLDAQGWQLGDINGMPLPSMLRQVITSRVTRLGTEVLRLLTTAAVIGQEFSLDTLSTVSDVDTNTVREMVEQAATAQLVTETADGTHARFIHALIREALYEDLAFSRRRQIHQQVGEVLMARLPLDPDAIAFHLREARDPRAAEWLVKSGNHAERLFAWLTASERYAMAAALMEGQKANAAARGWLLLRLAWLRRWGDPQGGILSLQEAARLAEETEDRVLAGCVVFFRGTLQCRMQDYRNGLAALRQAVETLDSLSEEDILEFHAHDLVAADFTAHRRWSNLALWLARGGHFDEARAIAERALARGRSPRSSRRAVHAIPDEEPNSYFAVALAQAGLGEPEKALETFTHTSRLLAREGNLAGAAAAAEKALEWVILPYQTDRLLIRRQRATEAQETWMLTSGVFQADDATRVPRLIVMFIEGDWNEARQLALAVRAPQGSAPARYTASRLLAVLACNQGDPALAWTLIGEMLPAGTQSIPGENDFFASLVLQRAAVQLALNARDYNLARLWLETHDRWLAWNRSVLGRSEGQELWARYYRATGDSEQALAYAEQARTSALAPRQPLALLAAHRLLGELETDRGKYSDARTHLDTALALADSCAAPYERALVQLAFATYHLACHEHDDALATLDEVGAICLPLGAAPALARARALRTQLHATATQHPARLTQREVEVLRLVASGHTNRQIAMMLSISTRTVDVHIRNIFAKTGTENRAGATAFAFRHHLA